MRRDSGYTSYLQIRPNCLLNYDVNLAPREQYRSQRSKLHDLTREDNSTRGCLSAGSERRLRYAINLLISASDWKTDLNPTTGKEFKWRVNFVTLTLPARQASRACELLHKDSPGSDAWCHRHLLNAFLVEAKRRFGMTSYVWKAESQRNGNLHYHITTNVWMDYSILRNLWNNILQRHGYIAKYRQYQESWHATGFTVRPEKLATWDLDAQRKAYDFGQFTGWNQPNSIDVHSVQHIENLAGYLVKYMAKSEEGKRPIFAKNWGCSKNLTYNNKCKIELSDDEQKVLNYYTEVYKEKAVKDDFFLLIPMSDAVKEEVLIEEWLNYWQEFLRSTREYGSTREVTNCASGSGPPPPRLATCGREIVG